MTNFNQTDIDVRLELCLPAISDKTNELALDYLYGRGCAEKHLKELEVINAYKSVLCGYTILSDEVTEDDNCITEEEMQNICEQLSILLGIQFAAPGTTYKP